MFSDNGKLKICDFGVADVFVTNENNKENPRLCRGLCGSEPYIAPEQYQCAQYRGTSADIWSCGIIYFTMKYRSLPWRKPVKSDQHFLAFWNYRHGSGEWTVIEQERMGDAHVIINEILKIDPSARADITRIKEDEWFSKIKVCTRDGAVLNHGHTKKAYSGERKH
jgi:protein-serine/threonine kinase